MSLLSIENLDHDVRLGLWKMDEVCEDDFLCIKGMADVIPDIVSNYRSASRRHEKLCIYALLFAMTGDSLLRIGHEASGKPFIDGMNISITHTKGYAALILSQTHNVAVDIEYCSNRVERIVERFIRADESMNGVEQHLINWSAKETMYKFFSEEDLQYFDMRVHPFDVAADGELLVDNLKLSSSQFDEREPATISKALRVFYRLNEDYVITYAFQRLAFFLVFLDILVAIETLDTLETLDILEALEILEVLGILENLAFRLQ